MSVNGHDPLRAAIESAQRQRDSQQALMAAMQNAVQNPHTTERITLAAVGISREPDGPMLMIATPDGKRRDVPLGPDAVRALLRGLAPEAASTEQT
ncbi:MAG: hypothetical protein ACYCQK_01710 [Acidiferrobacteraceae bacterium]